MWAETIGGAAVLGIFLAGFGYLNAKMGKLDEDKVDHTQCTDRFERVLTLETKMDDQTILLTRIDERVAHLAKQNGVS